MPFSPATAPSLPRLPRSGDQGFLNSYFSGFAHAPLFDPDTHYTPDQYKVRRGNGRAAGARGEASWAGNVGRKRSMRLLRRLAAG